MLYVKHREECNSLYEERLCLVKERLLEIKGAEELEEPVAAFFREVAAYLLMQEEIAAFSISGKLASSTLSWGEDKNNQMSAPLQKEQYERSYANPSYAVEQLGETLGRLLSAVYHAVILNTKDAYTGSLQYICIYSELLVELYNCFEDEEVTDQIISECIYSFMHDYSEVFMQDRVEHLLDPSFDYAFSILMEADLSTPDYLYRYGLYVSENEKQSAAFLNTFSEYEIQAMADTYTEGYRIGFETCNKDITKKKVVEIRYPIGFERMVRVAVKNFEKIGLKSVVAPFSTSPNKQFEYDHKEDAALWMDKAYVEYRLECFRNALEERKEIAPWYGGPAVIEVFGEEPFSPQNHEANPRFSPKQQKLAVYLQSELSRTLNQYIHGEERSFTIIAYPVADIGEKYQEIFAETVKLNTLDYNLYRDMQQKIIDVLDTADCVHIVGANGNKTDLYVKIHPLANPQKETAFENCVADVNIPVGEVFTSPVLEGTNGKLHVSQVYLNELNYLNLEIDFEDGMIKTYSCTNFEDEEANRKYLEDNVLFHHKTLPMGEFAIGTNTTAYRMARVYDIADKLPILIAEKTGPHFAVGDTCYTYDEDNMTYNPDGKAIVARENSISALRKTDISKAYFNCHTDITIPYDELGAITVIRSDKTTQDIIRDGRFVVPGTELLNEPLE